MAPLATALGRELANTRTHTARSPEAKEVEGLRHSVAVYRKTIAAHSEEVWLREKRTDFRWIRTTSFLVVLNLLSVDFFVKI